MEKNISLTNRRVHSRHAANTQVLLKKRGMFGRQLPVFISDISLTGIRLVTERKIKEGQKAVVHSSSLSDGVAITCAWASDEPYDGKYHSGWVASKTNGRTTLSEFIEVQALTQKEDRRSKENKDRSSNRLVDISGKDSFFTPDEYPLYRRKMSNDRRAESRPANLSDSERVRRFSSENRRTLDRRSRGPVPAIKENTFENNLKIIGTTLRDILVPYLPYAVVRLLVGKGDFVFIAHARDLKDVVRVYPFAKWVPEKWLKKWWMGKKPFLASRITGLKDKEGKSINGWFLVAPRWTVQMMKDNDMARRCIEDAVKLAEKVGARVAGLGAFTSIVTHDGKDLLGKTKIGLTTGNPLSAAVAVQNVLRASALVGLDLNHSTAAIIGAAGSVGSGCARVLADQVKRLILIDINKRTLGQLVQDMPASSARIEPEHDLTHVPEADVVIVATNSPGIVIHSKHLKEGSIVIDCAQPKNVSDEVPSERHDVLVIESAVVETPGVDCHFDFDLNSHEALGCLAETMVLSTLSWPNHYAIGKAQKHQVQEIYAAARKAGFRLAYFRNSTGYITEALINNVRKIITQRHSKHAFFQSSSRTAAVPIALFAILIIGIIL